MVRYTAVLLRVPVIKFRKGGLGSGAGASASTPSGAGPATSTGSAQPQSHQSQPAAPMSTGVISDFDLPPRYRRQPISEEEMNHINGGGVV